MPRRIDLASPRVAYIEAHMVQASMYAEQCDGLASRAPVAVRSTRSRGPMSASWPASALHGHGAPGFSLARWSARFPPHTQSTGNTERGSAMDGVERREDGPDAITIARCQELLGDEAGTLSDHEIARIRQHAEMMAHLVVEILAANRRNPEYPTVSTARVLREATVGSMLPPMVGAVIYVRVSTKEQTENLSLPTQLRACEEYCRRQGYDVLARFNEEGESAKTTDRSQLQALLKYCRTHKGHVHFVVVYNLTRFAREKYDHFALRAHLKSLGISLRSATEPIDDTSTGKLMEGVLAAFAQFDNDVRADRTRAGMRAALELGRWTFPAPVGYRNAPRWSTTSLISDPERAPLIRRAFEELASARFSKSEVLARATKAGLRSRRGLVISPQSFGPMVRNAIYIGKVESRDFGVSTVGDFEPLVDEATFYRAQAVLDGRVAVSTPRQRNHPDFPLRGFVRCESCGRPLTGSWSKGRTARYAYYHCPRRCRAVNVCKATLEGAFVDELPCNSPRPATCGSSGNKSCSSGSSAKLMLKGVPPSRSDAYARSARSWTSSTRHTSMRRPLTVRLTRANATSCARS